MARQPIILALFSCGRREMIPLSAGQAAEEAPSVPVV